MKRLVRNHGEIFEIRNEEASWLTAANRRTTPRMNHLANGWIIFYDARACGLLSPRMETSGCRGEGKSRWWTNQVAWRGRFEAEAWTMRKNIFRTVEKIVTISAFRFVSRKWIALKTGYISIGKPLKTLRKLPISTCACFSTFQDI